MVLDYSKWDALELSDDSDIEVHPNVDKRSFIRAKQNQIHKQRYQRQQEIESLKYQKVINNGLLERINSLLGVLKQHQDSTRSPDEIVFHNLIEIAGNADDDPPQPPEGVHLQHKKQPLKYSQITSSLVDQIKKDVERNESNRYSAYIKGLTEHLTKVQKLQQELSANLATLEKEEGAKITSDKLHDGFNTSSVTKSGSKVQSSQSKRGPSSPSKKVELLNEPKSHPNLPHSGTEAHVQDRGLGQDEEDDTEDVLVSPLAKSFAQVKMGHYAGCLEFISENPEIVGSRKVSDGLLAEAFEAEMNGQQVYARTCVHQYVLLNCCRDLGRDGVNLFFQRTMHQNPIASKAFFDEVESQYEYVQTRARKLESERANPAGVERIQLHAIDPNTQISITIPSPNSSDVDEIAAREIFDGFPPELQNALQSASLEQVNKVLDNMGVDEGEDTMKKLGEGNMLGIMEGVVDATTKEGQRRLEELEREE